MTTMKSGYTYSAYTAEQDGETFHYAGSREGAICKAKAYARAAFPAWHYYGCGPTIVVRSVNGGHVTHSERL